MSFGKYMKTKRICKVMTEADWDRIRANKERKLNSQPTFRGRLK